MEYWQIPPPESQSYGVDDFILQENYQFNEFDPEWAAQTLEILDKRIVHKRHHSDEHGIVYCKYPMTAQNSYVEFLVSVPMEYVRSYGKIFVGLVDQNKHKKENLLSKRWDS